MKKSILTIINIVFVQLFGSLLAFGQIQWTSRGPFGGHIISLAIHPTEPNVVYAGCDDSGGIYKTTNSGDSWGLVTAAIPDVSGWTIAIDPNNPDIVYGGDILGLGAYKTSDGGLNWEYINNGFTDKHISYIAINPDSSDIIYAGTGGFRFSGNGVYKSIDGGSNWITSGLTGKKVYYLAINPDSTRIIYAGTHGDGLYKSVDSGLNWFPLSLPEPAIQCIAIDPNSPSTIYASSFDGFNSRVYKSIDGGNNWLPIGLDNQFTWSIAFDPESPNLVYAATVYGGVYKSMDAGQNWNPVNSGIGTPFAFSIAVDPISTDLLYVGLYAAGVYRSMNGGNSWDQKIMGMRNTYIFGLESSFDLPGVIYATNSFGFNGGFFYESTDGGQYWSSLTPPGFVAGIICLVADPDDADSFIAGAAEGIVRTNDHGATWQYLYELPDNEERITSLVVNPQSTNMIYATAYLVLPDTGIAVLKSINKGADWNQVAFFPKTVSSNALHAESDILHGGTLAVDPVSPSTIYAGTFGGVFKSVDSGTTWDFSGLGNQAVFTLKLNASSSNEIYAGCESGKLFKSINYGGDWIRVDPVWAPAMITDILIDPNSSDKVYVARDASDWHTGEHGGISVSIDGGLSWSNIDSGMTTTHTIRLAVDRISGTLYAGTYGGGVFSRDAETEAYSFFDATPISPFLLSNYPNPFNQQTTIDYQLPQTEWITIDIINILGQEVKMLVNSIQSAGRHSLTWNGKNEQGRTMENGIYFSRLESGSNIRTIKLLLLK